MIEFLVAKGANIETKNNISHLMKARDIKLRANAAPQGRAKQESGRGQTADREGGEHEGRGRYSFSVDDFNYRTPGARRSSSWGIRRSRMRSRALHQHMKQICTYICYFKFRTFRDNALFSYLQLKVLQKLEQVLNLIEKRKDY
jgi:hypothetical protein